VPSTTHTDFEFGDLTVRYQTDPATGRVGLLMFPTALKSDLAKRRATLRGERFIDVLPGDDPWPASVIDPIAQVKILGDAYPGGFATGHTMRNSPSAEGFHWAGQRRENGSIITTLHNDRGHRIEHRLSWSEGDAALVVETEFFNDSDKPVTLEMLASFSLGGITPFAADDAAGRLRVHRFRSVWAAEGRLETRTIEELHLERSWSGSGVFSERFGQIGTMPVRKWFPFVAVEDTAAGVVWGAQLAWAGSWQMEIYRQHDELAISGGLADRESGHWMKTLAPGESLVTPPATISCVRGTLDDLCDRLTAMQDAAVSAQPAVEQDLPVIFNEFCTTWGDPSHANLTAIADRLRGTGVRYLVVDAGWYRPGAASWDGAHGDWVPGELLFPDGLEATAAAIRERGLIPGLWFEMETVGENSTAFSFVDHMLKRDGFPVTVRGRHFWDLNDPWVVDYLSEKVIGLLERCGFGYLKVDYNETLGLGCDDPDSLGEGLRKQVLASYRFFEKIRERLPHLVIENCSSGGHRLEPSMLSRTAMSSFSDAHELLEIPIIAANLHRLMLPRQSQIWAVLHPADSLQRARYSLASTFLGRMCLSGGIEKLPEASWDLTREAIDLYQKAAPVIKRGSSRKYGETGESWRHPQGWQAVVRRSAEQALVVVHTFAAAPGEVSVPLPGAWELAESFTDGSAGIRGDRLIVKTGGDFHGAVFLLDAR
jgi:alpha-galactosidase